MSNVGRKPSKALFEDGTYDLEEFRKVFVELEDKTEYKPAVKLVGSWREWNRLKQNWPQFCDHIEEWKYEVDVKLKSEALQKIQQLAKGDDQKALAAAKYLADEGGKRGRPSKAERSRAAKEIAQAAGETEQEKTRILKIMNGGKSE